MSTKTNGVTPKPTNGTEEKTTALVVPVTGKLTKKEDEELRPLDERLHRLNELFSMQQKYNKLQDSFQKLVNFEVTTDGERSRLTIYDDSRNDFTTHNAEIIQDVVDYLKTRIKERSKAIEPLLKW